MTPQEHSLLEDFLGRLQAAGRVNKDAEADALIHARLDDNPDATYLLVQRSLLTDRALEQANAQIAALRQQLASASGGGSFLGGAPEGFGRAPSQAFTPEPHYEQRAEPPAYGQPAAQPQSWRNRLFGGGSAPAQAAPQAAGPSFLGQAATTAAGVAGGMFLFNGIEHLIGGGGHNGFGGGANNLFGNNDAGSLGGPMTENITENVFVDDGRGGGGQQGFLDGGSDDGGWASNDSSDTDDSDNFI